MRVSGRACLIVAALLAACELFAQPQRTTDAASESAPAAGPIRAQSLDAALRELARQTGLQVLYVAELTKGRRTHGLEGSLPVRLALEQLLEGSGLVAEFLNARTVQIRQAAASPRGPAAKPRPPPPAAVTPLADPEVTVTARKRAENVLAVPISITVVPGATLARFGLADFQDMQLHAPGFVVTPTPANSYVFVRGIGTQGNVLAFESSVALFVDGLYGGRNRQLQNPPFLDVERVEVLRGPQGALFGRNTSAGAVSVTTARPTVTPELWVQGDYELERSARAVTAVASGPVTEHLQLRLAARGARDSGYLDNTRLDRTEPDRHDTLARVSVAWQPSELLDVYGRVDFGDTSLRGSPFELVPAGSRPRYLKRTDDGLAPERDDSSSLDAMLQTDWRAPAGTLTAIAGRTSFDYENAVNIQATAPAHLVVENAEDFDQSSLELRWLSLAGARAEWILGGYADRAHSSIPVRSWTDWPFLPDYPDGVTIRRYRERTTSRSLFGQLSWHASSAVDLTGSLRYTRVTKQGALTRSYTGFAPGALATPLAFGLEESFLDPSCNVQWEFRPHWRVFLSYARGSKGGGSNGPSATDSPETYTYGSERSRSIEAGIKGAMARGSLSLVAFDTRYRDLQKSVLDSAIGGFVTRNAAAAVSRGVELELSYVPAADLRLTASIAGLHTEFTDFPGAKCPFGTPGFGIEGASCNLAGRPLTTAPSWSGAFTVSLDRPLSARLRLLGDLALLHRSAVWYQPSYHPLERQRAFWKADLRAGLAAADDRWSATLLVRNATDSATSSLIFETFPFFIDRARDRVHVPDRPRSYTLQLRYRLH